MKVIFSHRNSTKSPYPTDLIESTIRSYLNNKIEADIISVSIWAVGTKRIHDLNKTYRQIDRATDVLSFTGFGTDNPAIFNLGEIVYCPTIVKKQAPVYHQTFAQELKLYLEHSIDHLLEEYALRRELNVKTEHHNRT